MILLLLYGPYVLLSIATLFCKPAFEKAGIEDNNIYLPLLNVAQWFKISGMRPLLAVLFFLPYINLLFMVWFAWAVLGKYRPLTSSQRLLGVLLWPIGLPLLLKKDLEYTDGDASTRSWHGLWLDVVLFIVIERTVLTSFVFSVYSIPTTSMEKTFKPGDTVVAERVSQGPRLPNTILSLPFFHTTLPKLNLPSYLTWIELPYYRFPGTRPIQHNDVVIFNYPLQTTLPVDKREYFMKRCVGLPGDTISISNGELMVNSQKAWRPPLAEKSYMVRTDSTRIDFRTFEAIDVTDGGQYGSLPNEYIVSMTDEARDKVKSWPYVKSVTAIIKPLGYIDEQGEMRFPNDTLHYPWNPDQYGPLAIPKHGVTVDLNMVTLPIYQRIITEYEHHTLKVDHNIITIDGKPATTYTFKMDYYFMMGDNRDNSLDSRYWGFVPEDHIDGRVIHYRLAK